VRGIFKITLASLIAALACTGIIYAATTVGTNISTTGTLSVTASTTLNGVEYGWPSSDGSANQVLTTNSSGVLSWSTASGGSGSLNYGAAGAIPFYSSAGTTATGTTNSLLYWDDTNARLGIGTTTPASELEVVGNAIFTEKESLSDTSLTSVGASGSWQVTGDCADTTGDITCTYSTGTGTITQTSANMAVAPVGDVYYRVETNIGTFTNDPVVWVESTGGMIAGGADDKIATPNVAGDGYGLTFLSASSPTDFVLTVTLDNSGGADVIRIDDIFLKREVISLPSNADATIRGNLAVIGSSEQGDVWSDFGTVEIFGQCDVAPAGKGCNALYVEQKLTETTGSQLVATNFYPQLQLEADSGTHTFVSDVHNTTAGIRFGAAGDYVIPTLGGHWFGFSDVGGQSGTVTSNANVYAMKLGDADRVADASASCTGQAGTGTYTFTDYRTLWIDEGDDLCNGVTTIASGIWVDEVHIGSTNYGIVLDGEDSVAGGIAFGDDQDAELFYLASSDALVTNKTLGTNPTDGSTTGLNATGYENYWGYNRTLADDGDGACDTRDDVADGSVDCILLPDPTNAGFVTITSTTGNHASFNIGSTGVVFPIYSELNVSASKKLTQANILALNGTPIEIAPATGGAFLKVNSVVIEVTPTATGYVEPSAPDDLALVYDTGSGSQIMSLDATPVLVSSAGGTFEMHAAYPVQHSAVIGDYGKNIAIKNIGNQYTCAGTCGTIQVTVYYTVVSPNKVVFTDQCDGSSGFVCVYTESSRTVIHNDLGASKNFNIQMWSN
jgi:hypothetical protein